MPEGNSHSTTKETKERHVPYISDILIGTALGSGYWPWGPGTAGAAFGTALWCLYAYSIADMSVVTLVTLLLALLVTLLSIRPIDRLERFWGPDPSRVVIDEAVGVWVTLLAVPSSREWYYVFCAFLLFRVMDILKPLGCRAIDRKLHGGWGVMLDDILAGVYGAVVLWAITFCM